MRPTTFPCLALLLSLGGLSHAASGSILTYMMPPGGEGAASVALGVAIPGGPSSMVVNPALLAWEGARTSSVLQYSWSRMDLLPFTHRSDLSQEVRSFGIRFPFKPGTDLALGYSWNHIDFGTNTYEVPGVPKQTIHSEETVHHFVLSGRLGGIASAGVGYKSADSRLAPNLVVARRDTLRGTASAESWDLGLMVAPRWRIPSTSVRVGPSMGVSWINVEEDQTVSYGDSTSSPIPHLRRWGTGVTVFSPDLVSVDLFLEDEADVSPSYPGGTTRYQGWSLDVLGLFKVSSADLTDYDGANLETHESYQATFDLKQIWRLRGRLETGDWTSLPSDRAKDYPLPTFDILGAKVSPNLRLTYTRKNVRGWDYRGSSSANDAQERIGWAISL
ncbi:MAG: hypothetical protein IPK50_13265 [Fibrobacterota bacterium]|nr:hypothetical protein [Fibrobacterota bacterium]QQS03277.1 MAG: hypothetical protein IPK50_13265 [Fibrobacterota bacterium]